MKRSTIAHEREGGRVYILLGGDQGTGQGGPGRDQYTDLGGKQGTGQSLDRTAELIATLKEQLAAERQAHAEARRIIAGLVERIPALEAPPEAGGSPESAEDASVRGTGREAAPEREEAVERRSERPWWRRVFGGS